MKIIMEDLRKLGSSVDWIYLPYCEVSNVLEGYIEEVDSYGIVR